MPVDLPQPPYAYVVDVRPFDDGCIVPHCSIAGRRVSGLSDAIEYDGDFGSYLSHGTWDKELFFRRARVLKEGESYAFDIPASSAASELDLYLSAATAGTWSARLTVTAQQKASVAESVLTRSFEGTTQKYVAPATNDETGKIERYQQHVRVPLPSRRERILHVVIENSGKTALALGSPLVMKRVEGRGPRQAFVVVFDAVPFYLLDRLFSGTGDAPTEFFHNMANERGLFFPQGYSPALSTQSFVRRFFRNGYFRSEGEPLARGLGLDEEPPARSPTPMARLAEQGFLTEQFMANMLFTPHGSSTGVDGGYQNEMMSRPWPALYHPRALAARFDAWLKDHSHDDTWAVFWMSTPHDALRLPKLWSTTRPFVRAPSPPGVKSDADYRAEEVQARWENLLDSADSVRDIFQSAARYSPAASRLWFLTADHGLIEAMANAGRAARYAGETVGGGPAHRFFGSTEETWTPFGLLYDGVARPPGGARVVHGRTMAGAAWRAFERLFDVDVDAPDTTSWDSPALSPDAYASRWVDDGSFSVGHAGAIRCASGKWGYRTHHPKLTLLPIWEQAVHFQRMLGGTDRRSGAFTSEELYDDEADPLETRNVAGEHPEIVLTMRRRTQDFASTYYDAPDHPRYRHVLTFSRPLDLVIEGPRAFKLKADGNDVVMTHPRRAQVHAKQLEILEDREPMAIVSINSSGITTPLLLRCASSGQPLDELGPERDRFDLGLARYNCVERGEGTPPEGEVWFSAERIRSRGVGAASGSGADADTVEALRRWGYVRDLDQKH